MHTTNHHTPSYKQSQYLYAKNNHITINDIGYPPTVNNDNNEVAVIIPLVLNERKSSGLSIKSDSFSTADELLNNA
jgi:hypothetical protein